MKSSLIPTPFGELFSVNGDFTASGMSYKPVEKFIEHNVLKYYNNAHSNAYNGKLMADYIEQSRNIIRKELSCKPCDKIIFTGNGCSGAITHLIHTLNLRHETSPRTTVFVSVAEHHSNYLPWKHLPVDFQEISMREDGQIDYDEFNAKLVAARASGAPCIASFIACSNVTGIVQPIDQLVDIAHAHGALIFFDYAAAAPYIKIAMHSHSPERYIDAIFISPHKFLGGPGACGVLVANQKLFRNSEPYCPGGGTVRFVCKDFQHYSSSVEVRESGGTPNIVGCIRAGLVFQVKGQLQDYITRREHAICKYVMHTVQLMADNRRFVLLNPRTMAETLPIISFIIPGLHYNFVVLLLNDLFGIQSRGGVSCCSVFAQYLLHINRKKQEQIYNQIVENHGVPNEYGWCRVTFHYTMNNATVQYILQAIKYIVNYGVYFLPYYEYTPSTNNWIFRGYKHKFPELNVDKVLMHNRNIVLTSAILQEQYKYGTSILRRLPPPEELIVHSDKHVEAATCSV